MGRFKEIIDRYGLKLMEVGTNHLRIFADNRKLFDYYPLRMKLFDYRQWKQLTYPSLIEVRIVKISAYGLLRNSIAWGKVQYLPSL
jgi:hypothetical protein